VTRWRVTGKRRGRTWLESRAVLVSYYVYKGAGPIFQGGVAFSLLLIFRVKYTLLLRASSNPLARLLQPTNVLLYIYQLVVRLTLYARLLTLLWPRNSPDLSAIERPWFWMKRETAKHGPVIAQKQLKKDWIIYWKRIP
jgi:hypothetical protein